MKHKALYSAFDIFPSTKGAAIHINHMAQTLFDEFEGGMLTCLGNEELAHYQNEDPIEIFRFKMPTTNYLKRALAFRTWLTKKLTTQNELELVHFRDPWSGSAILNCNGKFRSIYEINGLPSIELPFSYPNLSQKLLNKVRQTEKFCWENADQIFTPAQCIKDNLISLGVNEDKIKVIYNGADIPSRKYPKMLEDPYLLYIGALQPWQGMTVLLKALSLLKDFTDLKLVICSSTKIKKVKETLRLIRRLDLDDRVIWQFRLPQNELKAWLAHATVTVAPLTDCARNLKQGCCPLKVLEYMAHGKAVVASDLPAVREIISSNQVGKLVRPDRPADLARAIRYLLEMPDQANEIGKNAKQHIQNNFTWGKSTDELRQLYNNLRVYA